MPGFIKSLTMLMPGLIAMIPMSSRRICDNVGCKYATAPTYLALIRSLIKTMEEIWLEK